MNTPSDFIAYLQQIIDRHGNDLSILLNERYGMDQELTPTRLLACYQAWGEDFLKCLQAVQEKFDGEDLAELAQIFETGKSLVTDVKNIGKTKAGPAPVQAPAPEKKKSSTKKIIVLGIVVVAVLTTIYFIVKAKK